MRIETNSPLFVVGLSLIIAAVILAFAVAPRGIAALLLIMVAAAAISCTLVLVLATCAAKVSGGTVGFRRLDRRSKRRQGR